MREGIEYIIVTITPPAELAAANTRFRAKILHARRTMTQDGRLDEEPNDQAVRNEEPPD